MHETISEADDYGAASSGLIVVDAELQITGFSDSCQAVFSDWPADAKSLSQLENSIDGFAAIALVAAQTMSQGESEYVDVALDGRLLQVQLTPLESSGSELPVGLLIVFREKSAHLQQRRDLELLADIAVHCVDAVIVHEPDGVIRYCNKAAEALFGYCADEMLGASLNMLIDETEQANLAGHISDLLEGRGSHAMETTGLSKDGLKPDLWLHTSILSHHRYSTCFHVTNCRDISEKRRSDIRLVALVESTPDPFIIVQANGNIERVNKQAENLFGYARQDLIGKSYKMLVPERFRVQHDALTLEYQGNPVMRQMGSGLEMSCLTCAGEEIPVEIGLSPVVAGGYTTVMVRFRDIREQKHRQRQLDLAHQKAVDDNRTKSRFLAAASHDLRQPLQSISMHLGALAGTLAPAEKARVLSQARMALDTTSKLLNALLNITKLESGKVQPEMAVFTVGEVLERVHNTESQQANEKVQKLTLATSTAVVVSDPALLEQLLTNLVANAIKYTPPQGHILLGCRRLKNHVCIQVLDDGPGMAPEALGLIFDEYHQLEHTGHYEGRGLGLGLSIVKLLAELLQLKLQVNSVPGRGSSFSVLVPLAHDRQIKRRPSPVRASHDNSTGTLLIIDDDIAVLESTSLFLRLAGFRILEAQNSAQALAAIANDKPDLIITDYGLAQHETGIDLLQKIRETLQASIPAIVITGDSSLQKLMAGKEDNYSIICKPVDAQSMLQLVQRQCVNAEHPPAPGRC